MPFNAALLERFRCAEPHTATILLVAYSWLVDSLFYGQVSPSHANSPFYGQASPSHANNAGLSADLQWPLALKTASEIPGHPNPPPPPPPLDIYSYLLIASYHLVSCWGENSYSGVPRLLFSSSEASSSTMRAVSLSSSMVVH